MSLSGPDLGMSTDPARRGFAQALREIRGYLGRARAVRSGERLGTERQRSDREPGKYKHGRAAGRRPRHSLRRDGRRAVHKGNGDAVRRHRDEAGYRRPVHRDRGATGSSLSGTGERAAK